MSSYEAKEAPPKGMEISNRPAKEEEDMSKRNYIRWDAEGVEKVPPNEAEDIQAVADMINCMQKAQWNSHRHCYSGQLHIRDRPWRRLLIVGRHSCADTRARQRQAGCSG